MKSKLNLITHVRVFVVAVKQVLTSFSAKCQPYLFKTCMEVIVCPNGLYFTVRERLIKVLVTLECLIVYHMAPFPDTYY